MMGTGWLGLRNRRRGESYFFEIDPGAGPAAGAAVMAESSLDDGVDTHGGEDSAGGTSERARRQTAVPHVCPFCGAIKERGDGSCPRCTLENTPATRQATKARIGPWYVLQTRNPAAPGMRFETLLALVDRGRVKPRSIVRGPTTHQFWRYAAQVKGLSREFGLCYSCGQAIERTTNLCSHCNRLQDPPVNPNVFLERSDAEPATSVPMFGETSAPPLLAEGMDTSMSEQGLRMEAPGSERAQPRLDSSRLEPSRLDSSRLESSRPRKSGEGFLSAKDLATAFKLKTSGQAMPAPIAPSSAGIGPVIGRQAPASSRWAHRRSARYIAIFILALAVAGVALQFHRDLRFRNNVIGWYEQASGWAHQQSASLRPASAKSDHGSSANPPPSSPALSGLTAPATSPASQPSKWDELFSGSSDNRAAAPKAHQAPAKKKPSGTVDDVRALYRSAIDAEASHDDATAIQKYEQIEEFSRELWPRDLELRLKEARQRRLN